MCWISWLKVLAMMKGEERERMMQMYEAAGTERVGRKAMIERMVEERAFEKERKKKVRLIKEGIRRKYFQQGKWPRRHLELRNV